MGKKYLLIAAFFFFLFTIASSSQSKQLDVQPKKSEENKSDNHRNIIWDILAFPQTIFEKSFYPFKKFMIFSQRVDLVNRVTDFFYNDERTAAWLPKFSFDGESGTGVGISLFHHNLFDKKKKINLSFLSASAEDRTIKFLYEDPSIKNTPYHFGLRFYFSEDGDDDFFVRREGSALVTGNKTTSDDEVSYELDIIKPEFFIGRSFSKTVSIELLLTASLGKAEGGTGSGGPIPIEIDGVGSDNNIIGGSVRFQWDKRDLIFRPNKGSYMEMEIGNYYGIDGRTFSGKKYAYTQYRLDLQGFIPLFAKSRVLVIRGYLEKLDARKNNAIPFYELPLLDKNHALRGYARNRFRDDGALLFNVEYRYPIWDTWEGVFFLDEGQVFKNYRNIELKEFNYSAGSGVRFTTKDNFLFNLQAGFSDEGTEILFQFEQEF